MRVRFDGMNISPTTKGKRSKRTMIYSPSGIFRVAKDSVIRLKAIDKPIERYRLDSDTELLCDRSVLIDDEEWYQIPYDHVCMELIIDKHVLRPCSPVALYIERASDETITDMYFETNEPLLAVMDDIRSMVSKF